MPATLYLRPNPRAIFLITETHALVFRQPDASESKASRSVVVAEFLPIEEVDVRGLVRLSQGKVVEGVLGVTSVPTERSPVPEIFLILVSAASVLPPLLPRSKLRPARVVAVEFHSLSSAFWDSPELALASTTSAYDFDEDDPYGPGGAFSSGASTQSNAAQQGIENPCNGMRRYLEAGGFFFAEECKWDISTRMGEVNWVQADKGVAQHPLETFDERFVWNASLLEPFIAFRHGLEDSARAALDRQSLLIPVIQGFCGSLPVSTGTGNWNGASDVASLGIISRLSWKRAGARFRTRGIDDDGQVANFVETEVILALDGVCMSYVEVRGSVPLFWQQPNQGIQTLQQKVEITRPPQASQPAFDKHFLELLEHYHSVHAVNLLGQKDAEAMLSSAYTSHLAQLKRTLDQAPLSEKGPTGTVSLTPYDFHSVVRNSGDEAVKYDFSTGLREVVQAMEEFGWTVIDSNTGQMIEQQQGVFRINCLDCLDRTNYIQDVISSIILSRFLYSADSMLATNPTFWAAHRELWADNGDRLSKIYAGTGAINTSATRTGKKTFAGLLSDATKSVSRAYINNFQDKGKQTAIDMLLGMMAGQRPVVLFDPIGDSVHIALQARVNEYSQPRVLSIFSGTWNLNGKPPDEDLDAWLFPPDCPTADIYAIAFQEIVELNAQQILQTDPTKRKRWEAFIMTHFKRHSSGSEYLLLRSEQLVGTALIIIVKADITQWIRNIESATKKTGLSGLSGNKGGVGIRMDLYDSTVCFMTAHLAAGHGNVAERNADYRTISQGLKFLRGKTIDDHNIVIWGGDFNYRISMPNEEVREAAQSDQLDPLLGSDQLCQAMDANEVFGGYEEGPITFRPTYKYDNGTDEYDSSEKARIPAWTDRILFKGSALRLKEYHRAELRTSDHRPVYAVFDATIRQVDQAKKDAITREITHQIRQKGPLVSTGDEKIQRTGNGGVTNLVKQVPNGASTPSLVPRPPRSNTPPSRPPAIPPRPSVSEMATEPPVKAYTARKKPPSLASTSFQTGRATPPPLPQRSSPAPAIVSTDSSLSSSPVKSAISRRPPPSRPEVATRSEAEPTPSPSLISPISAASMSNSTPAPFIPRESTLAQIQKFRSAALATPPSSASSPPKPAAPEKQSSLDMDGPPPSGLKSPVVPDRKPPLPVKKLSLPASTASIASEDQPKANGSQSGVRSGNGETPDSGRPAKIGSVADRLKQWESLNAKSSSVSTPGPGERRPAVPKKPETLRSVSGEGK